MPNFQFPIKFKNPNVKKIGYWILDIGNLQNGSVLLLALLILSTVLASSVAVGTLVLKEIRSNRQLDDAVVSYYAAESGIEKGLWSARNNPTLETGSSAIALPNTATVSVTAANKGETIAIPFLAKGATTQVDIYNPEGATTGNLGANIDTLHIKKDGQLTVTACKERLADGTFGDCGNTVAFASDAVTGLDPAKAYRFLFRADGDVVRSIALSGTKADAPETPVVLGTPLTVSSTGAFTTSRQALKVSIPTSSPFDAAPVGDTGGNASTNDFALSIVGSSPIDEGDRPRFGESGALPTESLLHYWIFGDKKTGDVSETNYDVKIATLNGAGAAALHRYPNTGTYTVQVLVVSETGKRAKASFSITVLNIPPVADAGRDTTAFVGDSGVFNDGGSYAGVFDTLSYYWDVDARDGLSFDSNPEAADLKGASPSFYYRQPSPPEGYTATLLVMDDDGDTAFDTVVMKVNNLTFDFDVAVRADKAHAQEGEPVTFTASVPPTVTEPLTYYWVSGNRYDGLARNAQGRYELSTTTQNGTASSQQFQYPSVKLYTVSVMVVTASGKQGRASMTMDIRDALPHAMIALPSASFPSSITINAGRPITTLDARTSYSGARDYSSSPGTLFDSNVEPLRYLWDFDASDGSTFTADATSADLQGPQHSTDYYGIGFGTGPHAIVRYLAPGTYTTTLGVRDDDGNENKTTQDIRALASSSDFPLVISGSVNGSVLTGSPLQVGVNNSVSFTVRPQLSYTPQVGRRFAVFSGLRTGGDTLSIEKGWTMRCNYAQPFSCTPAVVTFTQPGIYTVSIIVRDTEAEKWGWEFIPVQVIP